MNRRISHRALRRCAAVAWRAAKCGMLVNGGKRKLNSGLPLVDPARSELSTMAAPIGQCALLQPRFVCTRDHECHPLHFLTTLLLCVRRTFEHGSILPSAASRSGSTVAYIYNHGFTSLRHARNTGC